MRSPLAHLRFLAIIGGALAALTLLAGCGAGSSPAKTAAELEWSSYDVPATSDELTGVSFDVRRDPG